MGFCVGADDLGVCRTRAGAWTSWFVCCLRWPLPPPFQLPVPVRTAAEHPVRLHSWHLRMYASQHMFQPRPAVADAHLREVLTRAAGTEATAAVPDIQALISTGGVLLRGACSRLRACLMLIHASFIIHHTHPLLPRSQIADALMHSTPWFDTYRDEFFRMLMFSEHETTDHPIASA